MHDIHERLRRIRAFALDMDGTIYMGERLFPFTRTFLERAQASGRKCFFLTNNSSKSSSAYLQKLNRLGIEATTEQIITSGHATVTLLKRHHPGKRVFLLGTDALREEFGQSGIIVDNEAPEVAVVAFDTGLTYERLCGFCDCVRTGLPYIATHPDLNCPTEHGFIPDTGAFMALIHASTGRNPDAIAGKPHRPIVDEVLVRTGFVEGEIAMIGDRLYTDIKTGLLHGLLSILVLSGETNADMLAHSDVKPDLVFESLAGLMEYL
ncbi:MAG: HAD-IIA family hydrolase [Acetivibrionales bacterium]|jgi:HAD superfamily hydrolase (TIGR01450 family)